MCRDTPRQANVNTTDAGDGGGTKYQWIAILLAFAFTLIFAAIPLHHRYLLAKETPTLPLTERLDHVVSAAKLNAHLRTELDAFAKEFHFTLLNPSSPNIIIVNTGDRHAKEDDKPNP